MILNITQSTIKQRENKHKVKQGFLIKECECLLPLGIYNVPVVVLSSGMVPIIRALLVHLVGENAEDIQIVSNDVASRDGKDINTEGGWKIVFHDER